MNTYKIIYDSIKPFILPETFGLPNSQKDNDYFPDFLRNLLESYSDFYTKNFVDKVDDKVPFDGGNKNVIINKIVQLSNAINETVRLHYEGKVQESSINLFKTLDELLFDDVGLAVKVKNESVFYRARANTGEHFERMDLFHIDFKLRHIVSTNRYSIPGFPALYLGDTTYVCWEEFNQHRLRDLWFVKLENKEELNVLKIQRIEDFLMELEEIDESFQLTFLLRYLITFPLSLACTVRVNKPNGNFKPEYIIPQLLSEYVSKKEEIDGVKFPSTKVDYNVSIL
jgi:hypothetical protein